MKTINYREIKAEQQKKYDALITESNMFFAFSNEQFAQNKCELAEGDKYVAIGAGGYMPKSKIQAYLKGSKEIRDWFRAKVKESEAEEAEILDELSNRECFYVGDIEDAMEVLGGTYTEKQVWAVYHKYKEQYQ